MNTSFHALGVPSAIADRLTTRGIVEPFPIQSMTLPGIGMSIGLTRIFAKLVADGVITSGSDKVFAA